MEKMREGARVLVPAPLSRALDQSEQVKDKVEECAADLSSVNAVLKEEIADGVPLQQVERALGMSEEVEVKVLQCAVRSRYRQRRAGRGNR